MGQINYLGDVKRQFHHVKVLTDGHEDYEPAMVLIREGNMGRSFVVPLSCMWKYLDPKDNHDVAGWDRIEFDRLAGRTYYWRMLAIGDARAQLTVESAAVVFAEALNAGSGILLCTGFSLYMACSLLGLSIGTPTLVQLLMFIQDGLEDLKAMPPAEAENKFEQGEAMIRIDGKTYHIPVETTATDQARDNQ